VVKALKIVVALEDALLRSVRKSIALVEFLPERVASAASCRDEIVWWNDILHTRGPIDGNTRLSGRPAADRSDPEECVSR
jgi:hypothetical protein